jgi:hypothetical protein
MSIFEVLEGDSKLARDILLGVSYPGKTQDITAVAGMIAAFRSGAIAEDRERMIKSHKVWKMMARIEELKAQVAVEARIALMNMQENKRLHDENDILRGIAAKVMPCHYCGVDSIGKCPHGFPGCLLADDIAMCDDRMAKELVGVRAVIALRDAEISRLVSLNVPRGTSGPVVGNGEM